MLEAMSELNEALVGESYGVRPAHILEGVTDEHAQASVRGAPHTLYQELWHLAFWQEITLQWVRGVETPYPARPEDAFPTPEQQAAESWGALRERFLRGAKAAAALAGDGAALGRMVRCPSRPGEPVRAMSVEEQLVSLAAHNAYHLGRMVLLRQMLGAWPPPAGGFTW
ncbi:MAG: DinB family protein [Acidobacteriota bacterium]|nr:DinB family protein [Acidobacteriota bacterium]